MRGLIQSGFALRARSFHVVPGSSSSWSMLESCCAQRDLVLAISRLALVAAVAGCRRKPGRDRLRHLPRIAHDADRDALGEPDAIGVDVDLDDLGILRPVVEAIARQRRERVEARAQRQHHVRLADQLHARLRAVVAERAGEQRCEPGKASLCW